MNKSVKIIIGVVLGVLLIVGLFFLSSLAGSKNFKEISYNEYQNLIKESGNYVVYIGNKDSDALKTLKEFTSENNVQVKYVISSNLTTEERQEVFSGDETEKLIFINKGKEAFDYAYKNRISYIDFKFKYLKSNKNMKDSTDISKYINEAIKSLNDIDDDILKELKINELSREFGIDESVIKNKIKLSGKKEVKKEEKITKKRYDKYDISEIRILYLMLNYDDVILYFENSLGYLIHDNMMALAYKIVEFRNDYGYFNYSDFIDYIADNELVNETIKEIMRYHNDEEYTESELEDYFDTIKEYSVKKRINELKREMNETLDVNKKIELANKINKINKEVLQW